MQRNPLGQQLRANRDNVWKAAQTLVDQGAQPSVNNVRQWLGGGSNSSISRYLQEWHASSQEERSVRLATPLHLQQSLDSLFQQMEQEKAAAINAAEKALVDRLAKLEHDKAEANSELAKTQQQLAETAAALAKKEQQLGDVQTELAQQQKLLSESQRQLALVRQQASQWQREAEDNRAQVNHLFHQQQHFQERWQAEAAKRQEATEEARWQWQNEKQQLNVAVEEAREEIRNLNGILVEYQRKASAVDDIQRVADQHQQAYQQAAQEIKQLQLRLADVLPQRDFAEQMRQQQQLLAQLFDDVSFLTEQVKKRQQLKSELEALKSSLGGA
ncbi:DNA-binding protein [Gallaecimonas mangrovi]|uniref:DNA-binding protein n=1 Tax=Gallaecimonas mangrovi TaxID=2291597 RepID=UPI000E206252|nr:DNA-binding protein [Gallaecimonas mangrovi]